MAKPRLLSESFKPSRYDVAFTKSGNELYGKIKIVGKKIGKPSKRLTFHQKGLKILKATVIKRDKKAERQIKIGRINHHRSFEEVRLHADEILFPGEYEVDIEYSLPLLIQKDAKPSRSIMPMVDEANVEAEYNIQHAKD